MGYSIMRGLHIIIETIKSPSPHLQKQGLNTP